MLARPTNPQDREALIDHFVSVVKVIGSPGFPTPEPALRKRIAVGVHRSVHPLGVARQMVAIVACGDRSALLTRITAPTTIIHGRSDPLIPVAAAEDLGRKIPGSQVTIIDGMGHDLPPAVIPALLDAMRDTFARGER